MKGFFKIVRTLLELEPKNENAASSEAAYLLTRRDVIRTRDLCVPNAALYQAEPRAVLVTYRIINKKWGNVKEKSHKVIGVREVDVV